MTAENSIAINGNEFSFEPGETILEVARRHDIDIPTLCHLKGASPTGVCRVCVVEVAGADKLMASCATPAVAGMVVQTESPQVVEARKMIIRLMLSSGNHNCAIRGHGGDDWTAFQLQVHAADDSGDLCPVWGDCRLQDLAYRYQVSSDPMLETQIPYPMETANPFIIRDFSRCIQCGRCVQACNEVQVNLAINFGYQSGATKIVARDDKPLKDSDCVFCGECVQVCPVGALVEKGCPVHGPSLGDGKGENHLHLLRGGMPALPARQGRQGGQGHRRGGRGPQLRQPVRQRPVRLRFHQFAPSG